MDQVDRFFDEKREKRGRLWDEAKNGMKFEDDVANEKLDTWKLSSPLFPHFSWKKITGISRTEYSRDTSTTRFEETFHIFYGT